jgi:hypothetical protein
MRATTKKVALLLFGTTGKAWHPRDAQPPRSWRIHTKLADGVVNGVQENTGEQILIVNEERCDGKK